MFCDVLCVWCHNFWVLQYRSQTGKTRESTGTNQPQQEKQQPNWCFLQRETTNFGVHRVAPNMTLSGAAAAAPATPTEWLDLPSAPALPGTHRASLRNVTFWWWLSFWGEAWATRRVSIAGHLRFKSQTAAESELLFSESGISRDDHAVRRDDNAVRTAGKHTAFKRKKQRQTLEFRHPTRHVLIDGFMNILEHFCS